MAIEDHLKTDPDKKISENFQSLRSRFNDVFNDKTEEYKSKYGFFLSAVEWFKDNGFETGFLLAQNNEQLDRESVFSQISDSAVPIDHTGAIFHASLQKYEQIDGFSLGWNVFSFVAASEKQRRQKRLNKLETRAGNILEYIQEKIDDTEKKLEAVLNTGFQRVQSIQTVQSGLRAAVEAGDISNLRSVLKSPDIRNLTSQDITYMLQLPLDMSAQDQITAYEAILGLTSKFPGNETEITALILDAFDNPRDATIFLLDQLKELPPGEMKTQTQWALQSVTGNMLPTHNGFVNLTNTPLFHFTDDDKKIRFGDFMNSIKFDLTGYETDHVEAVIDQTGNHTKIKNRWLDLSEVDALSIDVDEDIVLRSLEYGGHLVICDKDLREDLIARFREKQDVLKAGNTYFNPAMAGYIKPYSNDSGKAVKFAPTVDNNKMLRARLSDSEERELQDYLRACPDMYYVEHGEVYFNLPQTPRIQFVEGKGVRFSGIKADGITRNMDADDQAALKSRLAEYPELFKLDESCFININHISKASIDTDGNLILHDKMSYPAKFSDISSDNAQRLIDHLSRQPNFMVIGSHPINMDLMQCVLVTKKNRVRLQTYTEKQAKEYNVTDPEQKIAEIRAYYQFQALRQKTQYNPQLLEKALKAADDWSEQAKEAGYDMLEITKTAPIIAANVVRNAHTPSFTQNPVAAASPMDPPHTELARMTDEGGPPSTGNAVYPFAAVPSE